MHTYKLATGLHEVGNMYLPNVLFFLSFFVQANGDIENVHAGNASTKEDSRQEGQSDPEVDEVCVR